jgi:Flp pilus assembly pilin Flp
MAKKMFLLNFLKDDQGVVSVEYILMVAAAGTLLIVGVAALMNAMSGYFNGWATFFNAGS